MTLPVQAPAGYAPVEALAFANGTDAVLVGATAPLPVTERPFGGASAITPDVEQPVARGVAVVCTAAGTISFRLADDSVLPLTMASGTSVLPLAVKTVLSAGTTATATCFNLA